MDDFAELNQVWDAWGSAVTLPVRTCVQAHMARPEILAEVPLAAAV